jgi:glycosyltransferase involved in cell wall biosynthesis
MIENIIKVKRTSQSNLKYTILIPSWNNLDYLKLCIESIRKNSHFQHQIIVIINEGSDGTPEWVELQHDIDYVYSPVNIGICYGLNICRSLIATNYVVYVNDDMYLLPAWDQAFDHEISRIGHSAFMLSATMIEPTETGNACVLVRNFGTDLQSFDEKGLLETFSKLQKADWSGSTWPPLILPLDLWDLVGGMSIEFSPGMYSDPDLSMKLWLAGVRYFKGLGNSKVYHFGSKSTGRVKKNKGSKLFMMKWEITSSLFVSKYLHRGEKFKGELEQPYIKWKYRIKNRIKILRSSFS